ncbi:hypothetical protein KP509_24G056000 [Ceratopteris richardii]|uniref:Protein ZIP4 homolog n=1 Tax=Ceratopteris richardii TaxID=49495 RepID=A0A8T2RV26_CERRI|nr:hypothetical protein KP509_24G056000 [Ceratopteris richardii]KAH7300314.1 hypothetical protein KP509_24G056000 [Ceratopteris richardii]KAH7300315.1 hypothetical protein KP509_24G056000 [Ceratopteris richardii]KAH7300316.1 hypothetical protein KP509_24G056000 [Ceratopteris richardii]KAH7300317.1 hypothetical protein KP509_24G056000 [Ceratopteris richardii]
MRISEVSSEQSAASDLSNDPSNLSIRILENLVVELEQMAPMISSDIVQKLRNLIPTFPTRLSEDTKFRIWKHSYRIWNTCVEINNSLQPGNEIDEEHAKLRQVACDLLVVAGSIGVVHSSLSKTAIFYFKTGTIWHKLGNHAMAAACFEKATEFSNKAKDHHNQASFSPAEADEEDKFLFDLQVARARTAWELQQKALVRSLLGRARGMLKLTSASVSSTKMYEELVEEFLHYGKFLLARQDKPSQAEAIQFLELAFEVCSDGISAVAVANRDNKDDEDTRGKWGREISPLNNTKFKILRFLAAGHLQNDNFESVLKCVDILKTGPDHASTPFLAMKAYVGLKRFEEAEKEAYILVAQRSTPVDVCAAAIDVLVECSSSPLAQKTGSLQDAVKKVFSIAYARFPTSKELTIRVLEKLLTQPLDHNSKPRVETALAIALDEKVIQGTSENSKSRISATAIVAELETEENFGTAQQCIHALLWNSGQEFFMAKDYQASIRLFEASLMYLSQHEANYTERRAKNLRVLCICHLALNQYERASEYIIEANKLEASIAGIFLKFKVSLQMNDGEGAAKQIEEMFQAPDFEPDYLTLASHEAISCKAISLAIVALSGLLEHLRSSGKSSNVENREAVLIRNIIALSSQDSTQRSTTLKYFKLARSRLNELGPAVFFGSGNMEEKEAQWYAGSAWNQGLDTAKSQEWDISREFFLCAADFYEVLTDNAQYMGMRRASMMLAVGATVAGNRKNAESNAALKEALIYLDKCQKIHKAIKSKSESDETNDITEIHLNLLSFEAKRRMQDKKAQLEIICHCSTLPGFQPKLFYSMGISDGGNKDVEVSMAAFEACLNSTLASPKPDYALVAATIRKMITITDTFQRDSSKAMNLYKQAHQILLGLDIGVYPKEEVQWLISTAWNRASLHVKFNRFTLAETWMNLALDMLKHAPTMDNFRTVMLDNLTSVLKRKAEESSFMTE